MNFPMRSQFNKVRKIKQQIQYAQVTGSFRLDGQFFEVFFYGHVGDSYSFCYILICSGINFTSMNNLSDVSRLSYIFRTYPMPQVVSLRGEFIIECLIIINEE